MVITLEIPPLRKGPDNELILVEAFSAMISKEQDQAKLMALFDKLVIPLLTIMKMIVDSSVCGIIRSQ